MTPDIDPIFTAAILQLRTQAEDELVHEDAGVFEPEEVVVTTILGMSVFVLKPQVW